MRTYIFQVQTDDFQLQLESEVTGSTIEQVFEGAKKSVKRFPYVKGLNYLLGYYEKVNNKFEFTLLKKDAISA